MSTPATTLLATITETLDSHGTAWQAAGDDCVSFRITDDFGTHHFFLSTTEESGMVWCAVPFSVHVPDHRRVAVAEAIARANRHLGTGHLELDFDDGELRWRASVDVEGAFLARLMVENMIRAGLYACGKFGPALLAVSFGDAEPAVAVASVLA